MLSIMLLYVFGCDSLKHRLGRSVGSGIIIASRVASGSFLHGSSLAMLSFEAVVLLLFWESELP